MQTYGNDFPVSASQPFRLQFQKWMGWVSSADSGDGGVGSMFQIQRRQLSDREHRHLRENKRMKTYCNNLIYRPRSNKCPLSKIQPRLICFQYQAPLFKRDPHSFKCPYTNKRPSYVSVIALQSTTTLRSIMVHLSLIAHAERHQKNSGLHLSISTIMFP